MKAWKKILPAIAVLGLVLTACGQKSNDKASSSSSSEQSSKVSSSSTDQISNKLGDEKLPQNNGIDASKTVSTKLDGDKDNFTISYISDGKTYASYTKHTYGSDSAAMQQVSYQSANNVRGLPTVDLGSNITGYSDKGAGQEYIQANFGNWSILTHGSNFGKTEGLASKQGKEVVAFIQDHQLPIPNKYGSISVEIDNTATITWQSGNDVYSVKADNVSIALKMATSLK